MTVFVTSKSFGKTNPAAVKMLEENGFNVKRIAAKEVTAKTISEEIGDADVLVVGNDPVDKTVLEAAKKLKLVHMHGTGLDAIDIESATEHGVLVANAPGANKNAVAEMTVALMLTVGRRIDIHQDLLKAGRWERSAGNEVSYSTVGIIGLGNIGKRVIELLKGFSVNVVGYEPYPDDNWVKENNVTLVGNVEDVFSKADFLVLAAPLMEQTEKIVNKHTLSFMKNTAYIINTARGGLIDEEALCEAIKNKKIAGAALDAYVQEPPAADSPLRDLNIVLTPHIAATSVETSANVSKIVSSNIIQIVKEGKRNLAINA